MLNLPKWAVLTTLLAACAATTFGLAFAAGDVAAGALDTVLCPQTGEEIAREDCPLVDATRADCPGKIECPLTGELVCRDRCPLEAEAGADGDGARDDAGDDDRDVPECCKQE